MQRLDCGSRGSIVNVASISSWIAQPEFVPYNVSKGAVAQLTRCCAMDFTDERVRVNAVGPVSRCKLHLPTQVLVLSSHCRCLVLGFHLRPSISYGASLLQGTIDTPGAYGHMKAIGEEALGPQLNDFKKGKKFFGAYSRHRLLHSALRQ